MTRISSAFTIPVEHSPFTVADSPNIHARPTRILRARGTDQDTRATAVSTVAAPGATCRSCASDLEVDAQFCGVCGTRMRARASLIGTTVDKLYRVEECIATGTTAMIYRAQYLPSGAEVALKVMHSELAYDHTAAVRFRREGRCLARLRDPRTVTVFDHGEAEDGTLYTAMELLRGERLDVRVRMRGVIPWRPALTILRGICSSLVEAHAHGIVHRNLPLANVVLLAGDAVKVIDFGLAKLRPEDGDEELTSAGQAIGLLRHAAPEQLAGRTCDRRADLYALGVIGYELMLGRLPIGDPILLALPETTPREVVALLRRCVATDPDNRFVNAEEIATTIDRLLAPREPVVAAAVEPVRRTFAHTSAFELQPPRIVIDTIPQPEFLARGSQQELAPSPRRMWRWKLWAAALVVCGVGLGTAVAGCV